MSPVVSRITLVLIALLCIPLSAAGAEVGRIRGELAVSDSGTASYSIPIRVPPGIAGVEPKLTIGYSHRAGDGLLGHGWDIGGLAAITRCPRTISQDSAAGPVKYDNADRYCLDGNRLRLMTGTYGQSEATYGTEIEGFIRITSKGADAGNTGPQWFEAKTRDGVTLEFGNTADSRIEAIGRHAARVWAVNRATDPSGNYVAFTYHDDTADGWYRVQKIEYRDPGSGTPRFVVSFSYETRPVADVATGYLAGTQIVTRYRLTRIDITEYTNQIRSYSFAYKAEAAVSSRRSVLESVTECATSPGVCLPPTLVTWQNGTAGIGAPALSTTLTGDRAGIRVLDVNGDGRDDVAFPSGGYWYVRLGQSNGTFGTPTSTAIASTNFTHALVTDQNGDGRDDLIVPDGNPGNWKILRSNGTTLTAVTTTTPVGGVLGGATLADLDGNGLDDVVYVENSNVYVRYNSGTTYGAAIQTNTVTSPPGNPFGSYSNYFHSRTRKADFNGDGRTDLWFLGQGSKAVCLPDCGTQTITVWTWQALVWNGSSFVGTDSFSGTGTAPPNPLLLDINGDGLTDAAYLYFNTFANPDRNELWVKIARGDGTFESRFVRVFDLNRSLNYTAVMDLDGDGLDDLLYPEDFGTYRWYRSNGTGFEAPVATSITTPPISNGAFNVMDLNGDGLSDIGSYENGVWKSRLHSGAAPDLATAFADGFGNQSSVVYAPLTDASVYTKASTLPAALPAPAHRNYASSMPVVKAVTHPDGIGGTYNLAYTYEFARQNMQGRGFLGFEATNVVDSRNAVKRRRTFSQDFPKTGLPTGDYTIIPGPVTVGETVFTNSQKVLGAAGEQRYWPHAYVETTRERTLLGSLYRQSTTTSLFDTYGNTTSAMTDVKDGAGGNLHRTTVDRTVINDAGNWCLGRVTFQSTFKSQPDGLSETRYESAQHDYQSCRMTSAIDFADSAGLAGPLSLTRSFGYDSWGNQSQIVTTGVPGPGKPAQARQTTRSFAPDGLALRSETSALGHTAGYTWDHALGVMLTRTDANQLTTTWTYDDLGRPESETRPDGSTAQTDIAICSSNCGVANGKYQVTTTSEDSLGTPVGFERAVFDSFERSLLSARPVLGGAESSVAIAYDAMGRVSSRTQPHLSPSEQYPSVFAYDVLGRPLSETSPTSQADPTPRTITFVYNALVTTRTEPGLGATATEIDLLGRPAKVTDSNSGITSYTYFPFGEARSVIDSAGNTKSWTYDARGNRVTQTDPDSGNTSTAFNAFGEMTSTTNARGQATEFDYDLGGRLVSRKDWGLTEPWLWEYDTAAGKGVGQIASITRDGTDYAEFFVYDMLGRLAEHATDVAGEITAISRTYDEAGRLRVLTYPVAGGQALSVLHQYDTSSGALESLVDPTAPSNFYWRAQAMNARGQVTQALLGNGLTTTWVYDAVRGHARDIDTTGPGGTVQDLAYAWHPTGSLQSRSDGRLGLTESFTYDGLDRLKTVSLNGVQTLSMDFGATGRVTQKSDVGSFAYGARPHAATTAGAQSLGYDADGNVSTRGAAPITWDALGLPTSIGGAGLDESIAYGPAGRRYRRVLTAGALTETTVYVDGLYEKVTTNGVTEHRFPIVAGGVAVAQVVRKGDGMAPIHYFLRDHLGSLDAVTDAVGSVNVRLSFDAWGRRRDAATWSGTIPAADLSAARAITSRGYTGHEMLDSVGLVHMNGRVYDPQLGRMISADPTIPGMLDGQAHDRYGYVLNNPLRLVDPSGFTPDANLPDMDVICGSACSGASGGQRSLGGMGGLLANARVSMERAMARVSAERRARIAEERAKNCNGAGSRMCANLRAQADREVRALQISESIAAFDFSSVWEVGADETYLEFNGSAVVVRRSGSGALVAQFPATSGLGAALNNPNMQHLEFIGPLPEGYYFLDPAQWDSHGIPRQVYNLIRGNGDWGAANVPLIPAVPHPYRDSFYLHGGLFRGSAGCIDAGLYVEGIRALTANQASVTVIVNYGGRQ